jgi:hypothetical protein
VSNPYRDRLLGIGIISRRSGATVTESRREDGVRVKATTDELGNTTTEHATKDDRVDVQINAPHIRIGLVQNEERSV